MSQISRPTLVLSVQASGAIAFGRAVQVVTPSTSRMLAGAQATVSGQKIIGIANRAAASGESVDLICGGTACCEAGTAIAVGSLLAVDSVGRVIVATEARIAPGAVAVTSTAANGSGTLVGGDLPLYAFGIALEAAGGAGEFIEVLFR